MAVKVCLDAGHYGKYNRSPAVSSYYESDMTWKLHNYLKKELESFGIVVVTTRTNQNTDRALYERGAASKGCNLFISVHSNAVGNGVNENVDYPVAYVLLNGSSTDIGLKLAKVVEAVMGTAQSGRTATRQGTNGDRNIGQDSTMKFQNRYPLSGMLICPYCGKTLRRRQVYKKKIQWLCSTYIEKGVKACKGIRIDDAELQGLNIAEQTVIEEVVKNGKKHYCYTSKADFDCGIRNSTVSAEIKDGSVLPSVNRPRRTVIKL